MKQGLSLRVSQHLALTPQLQQSIRLLQLSTLELSQEIEQMLDENPFLEREEDAAEAAASAWQEDRFAGDAGEDDGDGGEIETPALSADQGLVGDWEGDGGVELAADDGEWGGDALPRNGARDEEDSDATEWARPGESLQDHLKRQALSLRLEAEDRAALWALIESLNEDGYLEDTLEELAQAWAGSDTEAAEPMLAHLRVALHLLQSLDPVGVGARDLMECLQLQLQALAQACLRGEANAPDPELLAVARQLIRQPAQLLARRDVRRLAHLVGASQTRTRDALTLIARLEPKPGRRFAAVQQHLIVPDVIVTRSGAGAQTRLRVQLNPDVLPRLRVHEVYAGALRGGRRGGARETEGHAALQQRLQEARWFIKNIQQRFDTILRVSQAIVERQKNFFIHGELAMRPLVLREIADELGMHESTISRVTTAKYMATPFGTYELKYFFGSGLGTDAGGNASSTAVRALIRQFIAAEDPTRPLSDSQLSDLLKEQGIECARRTVAKYREALKIAPAHLRKSL